MKSNYTPCYLVLRVCIAPNCSHYIPHLDSTFTPISLQIRFHATSDENFRKYRNFTGY
ncbi:hypothetical protein T11_15896 [Trichinella zimbabwensis]|uniref:Uncharacterized protein n=1 Tax=Trichinella zimbabwensis TaxID=268475 RepID=A0A0V1GMF9_9BILA|nr:hypothetical protein T11_15896 [Trichinella zimbabwensis]